MTKLKTEAISKADIEEYLKGYSDFSFELSVLRKLTGLSFKCEHSGTYEDPITNKTREFDIRARKHSKLLNGNTKYILSLSVECKNIREYYPIVAHCVDRKKDECYLDLVSSLEDKHRKYYKISKPLKLNFDNVPYNPQGKVGKSIDQVGRKTDNSMTSTDGGIFEKISQALNSGFDLLTEGTRIKSSDDPTYTLTIPILVIPNGRLWSVSYDSNGNTIHNPAPCKNVEYFVGKKWEAGVGTIHKYYTSHLEIVEIDYLGEMLNKFKCVEAFLSKGRY